MSRILLLSFLSFTSGVLFRSLSDFGGVPLSIFIICLGIVFCALFFFYSRAGLFKVVAVSVLLLGFGMFRFDILNFDTSSSALDTFQGQAISLQGIVADEPDVRENHTKLTFEIEKVTRGMDEYFVETKALLITEHYPEFEYGDKLLVRGLLTRPENFKKDVDEPGRPFDYVSYLAKDGVFYQMFYPKIELVANREGNPIQYALFSFKHSLLENIGNVIPEPHASLLGGIILGAKRAIGEELLNEFRKVGIIHIVVLSGYNITIIADAVGRASLFLPRVAGITLSVLGIISFVLMTGAGATVVRASIMAFLVLLARATGRIHEVTAALFTAAFLMILWNPRIVLFDPSFELSFLATVGLIYLAPRLERFLGFLPTRFKIREFGTATLATQFFVLPLLVYMTGIVSFVSFFANILILPFIPLVMFSGFLVAFLASIHEVVSLPFAYASYLVLEYIFRITGWLSSLSWSTTTIQEVSLLVIVFVYCMYGLILFLLSLKKSYKM